MRDVGLIRRDLGLGLVAYVGVKYIKTRWVTLTHVRWENEDTQRTLRHSRIRGTSQGMRFSRTTERIGPNDSRPR